MKNDIKRLLVDYQQFHSEFQIENFIIRSQGDDWAKYKQCLREIDNRNRDLIGLGENLELAELEVAALRWRRFICFTKRQKVRHKIALANAGRAVAAYKVQISEMRRELVCFVSAAVKLKELFPRLDPEKRAALESESWLFKARRLAGIDIIVNRGVGQQTLEFILSLPRRERELVINEITGGADARLLIEGISGKNKN